MVEGGDQEHTELSVLPYVQLCERHMEKLPSETYSTLAKPGPIDAHIGARIRLRRKQLGITMPSLGEAIGVGIQQVHNFEKGKIRIFAARLYYIANALDVPVAFFYEDVPAAITASALAQGDAKGAIAKHLLQRALGEVPQGEAEIGHQASGDD